jgi:cytochrome P450
MVELCAELAVRAMMAALTPVDLTELLPDVSRFGHDVMSVVVGVRPAIIFERSAYRLAKARLHAAVDAVVARHARPEERDERRTYTVDAFLDARTERGELLHARGVRGACLYALCGASSYVGPLGAFLVYEITRHHALRARVLAEVDAAFDAGPFDPLRLRQMPALRAAYFETLRRYPIVFGLAYRASRDFDYEGHRVPRGEMVLVSPVPGHFDPEHFPSPFEFDAARFETRSFPTSATYAPFGMAPRTCSEGANRSAASAAPPSSRPPTPAGTFGSTSRRAGCALRCSADRSRRTARCC